VSSCEGKTCARGMRWLRGACFALRTERVHLHTDLRCGEGHGACHSLGGGVCARVCVRARAHPCTHTHPWPLGGHPAPQSCRCHSGPPPASCMRVYRGPMYERSWAHALACACVLASQGGACSSSSAFVYVLHVCLLVCVCACIPTRARAPLRMRGWCATVVVSSSPGCAPTHARMRATNAPSIQQHKVGARSLFDPRACTLGTKSRTSNCAGPHTSSCGWFCTTVVPC